MGLLDDAVILGGQMVYFKVKNNQRAKALSKWANAHEFAFFQKPRDYHGEIMQMPTADPQAARARGGLALSAKASMAHRLFGDSPLQTKLWAFCSNRFRGDWRTNANILEGRWNGTLMTAFDTLWFDIGDDQSREGEYSSVFAHCSAKLPRVIITPSGIVSTLKRLDESQLMNWGYHKVQFELDSFNKKWHVATADKKLTYDFISQEMMEFLMEHHNDKWHLEISEGGLLISTVFTLKPDKVERAMEFLSGFLQHVDDDLLRANSEL